MWNWKKFWALLFVGLAIWLVPGFFRAAGEIVANASGPAYDTTAGLVSDTADVVTGTDTAPAYAGPVRISEVRVTFDVNRAYHNWGQLLASYHQLPEITGRVYAARIVRDREGHARVAEELPDAGLLAQRRLNWRSATRMRWSDLRVRTPARHLPVGGRDGWHLCADLHEATEGHNILGGIQDALHFVHWGDWHLSDGDIPVAGGECVELDNNGFPYDYDRRALTRPGETVPTGWLTVRFEGTAG